MSVWLPALSCRQRSPNCHPHSTAPVLRDTVLYSGKGRQSDTTCPGRQPRQPWPQTPPNPGPMSLCASFGSGHRPHGNHSRGTGLPLWEWWRGSTGEAGAHTQPRGRKPVQFERQGRQGWAGAWCPKTTGPTPRSWAAGGLYQQDHQPQPLPAGPRHCCLCDSASQATGDMGQG